MTTEEQLSEFSNNQNIRRAVAMQSHFWFFHLYLNQYIIYPTAPFQRELIGLTEHPTLPLLVVIAFRGSGKSTLLSLSYPLWAILGQKKKRCILILSQTQYQAQTLLQHIKYELEDNALLRKDFGPFITKDTPWSADTIVIPRYDAKIIAASTEQSIRGIRHAEVRPDLIICDDIENMLSVKTMEGRNKMFDWLSGEIIPSGDRTTQIVIVGNLLHEDSLLMRLDQLIQNNKIDGIVKRYPITRDAKALWPAKFPTAESVVQLQRTVGNPIAWKREFELQIVPEEGQIISYEDIQYYDAEPRPYLPLDDSEYELKKSISLERICTGIDLAISQKSTADYTAMVTIKCFSINDRVSFYVLPYSINKRLNFQETIDQAANLSRTLGQYHPTELFVEQVGYQQSAIEYLQRNGLPAKGVPISGSDKRARLNIVAPLIQQGRVKFPKHGADDLIAQITGFGVERHDDLMDAFTLVVMQMMHDYPRWEVDTLYVSSKSKRRTYLHEPELCIRDDDEDEDDDQPASYFGIYNPQKWDVF